MAFAVGQEFTSAPRGDGMIERINEKWRTIKYLQVVYKYIQIEQKLSFPLSIDRVLETRKT